MHINKLLITGRMYRELRMVQELQPDKRFRFRAEAEVTASDLDWADAYVGFRPAPAFHFGSLQWVHALGAGVDAFLFRKMWKPGVILTRTTGDLGRKIAEYCISYMLTDLQYHDVFKQNQAQAEWTPAPTMPLSGQKAVIFGTGSIGQEIARVLSALSVEVHGISFSGEAKPYFQHVYAIDRVSECLHGAQWVINTLPLTEATYRIFDEALFTAMNGAAFINVGRGASVNAEALIRALDRKAVRLAVLDVFEEEPLHPESPLWKQPDIRITPHISAVTSVEEAVQELLATMEQLENGAVAPANLVDTSRGY